MTTGPSRGDGTPLLPHDEHAQPLTPAAGTGGREIVLPPEPGSETVELTVVLPCLNEAETLAVCIEKALGSMRELGINGEVLVADNGSTDGSQEISIACGARVVDVPVRGYGAALGKGISAARGRFVIMADADDSYALDDLGPFVEGLRGGADLVMGNRFKGGIAPGAMPLLHRILGNPVLSAIGRIFYRVPVGDFHCGMRGFRRDRIMELGLATRGMEFASEMVVRSSLNGLDIREVPTTLRPDGRSRAPHLRTWRDGWRHLRFLLAFSPRWLLWYPALLLLGLGGLLLAGTVFGPTRLGAVPLGVHSMVAAATAIILGVQMATLGVVSQAYATALGLLPRGKLETAVEEFGLRWGITTGVLLLLFGLGSWVAAVVIWSDASFGALDPEQTLRLPVLGMLGIVLGVQAVMTSFTLGLTRVDER